jgi:YaiO family outer membrane protein
MTGTVSTAAASFRLKPEATRTVLIVGLALGIATLAARADAQDDVLVKARDAARSGHRAEALKMLDARLAEDPKDVDARLLYGLVLSWDKRYEEARPVLQQVLTQAPEYTDARVALMNVELWSGRATEAMAQANRILAGEPGNPTARAVHDRLEAAARAWWATTSYTLDVFNDDTDPWQEFSVYVTRKTPVGPVIVRGNHATRHDEGDQLFELEFYPRFRPGTYAYISTGIASEHSLYPEYRLLFDLYQAIGRGFEISGGARHLAFDDPTQVYVGTLSKYVGNWMFTGKVYHVPAEGDLDSTSYHGGFRRYFGGDGTSYTGVTYSHGISREIRSVEDLTTLFGDTVRGEFDVLSGRRLRIFGALGVTRQERTESSPQWQTTIYSGLSVQF